MSLFHRAEKRLMKFLTRADDRDTSTRESSSELSNRFSQQFGKDHGWLVGQKMLLEFDPASGYEKAVRDFVLEAEANGEAVIVTTEKTHPVASVIRPQENVKILYMTHEVSAPKEISENEILVPWSYGSLVFQFLNTELENCPDEDLNSICTNLSGAILTFGLEQAYSWKKDELEMVASPRIAHLSLLNATACDPTEVAAIEGLFNNILTYGKEGLRAIKLAKAKRLTSSSMI